MLKLLTGNLINNVRINGVRLRNIEIKQSIFGGLIVGLQLIDPVINTKLALAVDKGKVAEAG